MRKTINKEHVEGYIQEHSLEIKTVQNTESANYGKEFIRGSLDIATSDDGMNVVTVDFTYVQPTWPAKNGKPERTNDTYVALKKIIDSCSNLSALEPLLHVAPEKILKHILQQYVKNLKGNTQEMRNFAQNGGLQKIQELKAKVGPKIQSLIADINSYYPADIVKYYSPDYAADLLNKIGGDVKA